MGNGVAGSFEWEGQTPTRPNRFRRAASLASIETALLSFLTTCFD